MPENTKKVVKVGGFGLLIVGLAMVLFGGGDMSEVTNVVGLAGAFIGGVLELIGGMQAKA